MWVSLQATLQYPTVYIYIYTELFYHILIKLKNIFFIDKCTVKILVWTLHNTGHLTETFYYTFKHQRVPKLINKS